MWSMDAEGEYDRRGRCKLNSLQKRGAYFSAVVQGAGVGRVAARCLAERLPPPRRSFPQTLSQASSPPPSLPPACIRIPLENLREFAMPPRGPRLLRDARHSQESPGKSQGIPYAPLVGIPTFSEMPRATCRRIRVCRKRSVSAQTCRGGAAQRGGA